MVEKKDIDLSQVASIYDLLNLAIDQISQEEAQAIVALAKDRLLPSLADAAPPPESGISENFYYYDPDGCKHQFTIRAATAAEFGSLLMTSGALRQTLQRAGWQPNPKPAPSYQQPQQAKPAQPAAPAKPAGKQAAPAPASQSKTVTTVKAAADPDNPQPGEWGFVDCDTMVVIPQPKGKTRLEFLAPDMQFPVFRHTDTPENLAGYLAETGAWTAELLQQAAEYEVAYRVIYQYSEKGRRTKEGNLYKDFKKVRLIG